MGRNGLVAASNRADAYNERAEMLAGIMRQGTLVWNAWRAEHPEEKVSLGGANVDLSGVCLQGADLHEANLVGICFQGALLSSANFSGADLSSTHLDGAFMSRALFRGAKLCGANLAGAECCEADFTNADLRWSDLTKANLTLAVLERADLTHARCLFTNFSGTKLGGSTLDLAVWGPIFRRLYEGASKDARADLRIALEQGRVGRNHKLFYLIDYCRTRDGDKTPEEYLSQELLEPIRIALPDRFYAWHTGGIDNDVLLGFIAKLEQEAQKG